MNIFHAMLEKVAEDSIFETQSLNRRQSAPILPGNYLPAAAAAAGTTYAAKAMLNRMGANRGMSMSSPSTYIAGAAGLYAGKKLRDRLNAQGQ
jgi:hypothetical protein